MALALVLRARRVARWLVLPMAGLAAAVASGCFTAGQGTQPPMSSFYFPTGLAVSPNGKVLYAINSDFDLQWNGGTLQSYHLNQIRTDAANLIAANYASTQACANPKTANSPSCKSMPSTLRGVPFLSPWTPNCMQARPGGLGNSLGVHVGTSCAPQVDSSQSRYFVQSRIVGAFAEDLKISDVRRTGQTCPANTGCQLRLFAPMAGNSTVTWADVGTVKGPSETIECGQGTGDRCDASHATGNDPNSPGNTRNVTMGGEPYSLAVSEDRTALAVTSETDTSASLLTTTSTFSCGTTQSCPTMQFVVGNLPSGGISMAAVPHDPYAVTRCEDVGDQEPCIRQAFLETFVGAAEVDLLRYYDDISYTSGMSSTYRPYLVRERAISIPTNIGSDFRGMAIDPTPRYKCQASATTPEVRQECGMLPARVFIASRTPPSVVYANLGAYTAQGPDPDALVFLGNIPLPQGPSKVYFAPVIVQDPSGAHYEPRIFVTLFDAGAIVVINPELVPPVVENTIYVGQNPYSMTFDPFGDLAAANGNPDAPSLTDIATHKSVDRLSAKNGNRYRFAYVGIFTQSYLQMIDLDDSAFTGTFEQVVFNFGQPSIPKGQANSNNSGSFF